MKLIDEWNKAHKMISVQAMAAASAIQLTWTNISPDLQAKFDPNYVHYITVALLVLGIVGRFINQPGVSADGKESKS